MEELQRAILAASITSSLGGAIPFPGVSLGVKVPIIAANVFHQMKALGLGSRAIEIRTLGYEGKTWTKEDFLKEMKTQLDQDDKLIQAWLPSLFTSSVKDVGNCISQILLLFPELLGAEVVGQASTAVPIVGSIVGAGLSGMTSYYALTKLLESNRKLAKSTIKILSNSIACEF